MKAAFEHAFSPDFATGKLFWRNPPGNHAELKGAEAGFICRGRDGNKDYWHIRAFSKTFKRSRVIFLLANGYWPEPCVDHINGESLDDRPGNLRECNYSQNSANSKARGRPLPKGVSQTRQGNFMARVTKNGITKSFGTFPTPEAADAAASAARKELFNEFA